MLGLRSSDPLTSLWGSNFERRMKIRFAWLQEMQLLLLRYREDIIAAKVSKEHQEETLKSEILFLKDQVSVEGIGGDSLYDLYLISSE